jgi:hypothetical protein
MIERKRCPTLTTSPAQIIERRRPGSLLKEGFRIPSPNHALWFWTGAPGWPKRTPGFPVVLAGVGALHAAFLNESRTRSPWWRPVQEIREPGPKMVFFQCFHSRYQGSCSGQLPFARRVGTIEGAAPHLFRPMYAQANMGHPSRGVGFVCWLPRVLRPNQIHDSMRDALH